MRLFILPLIACAFVGTLARRLDRRQFDGLGLVVGQLPGQEPFKREFGIPSVKKPGVKKLSLWYGPFTIKALNETIEEADGSAPISISMDPAGTGWVAPVLQFPKDITVLRTNASIVMKDGSKATITDDLYLHHLLFFDNQKPVAEFLGCDGSNIIPYPMSLFMAGSEDIGGGVFTTPDGRLNSGYYIGKEDTIVMAGDVVNLSNITQHVYAATEIEYIEGEVPGMMEASILMTNVGQCDGEIGAFQAPEGETKFSVNGTAMDVLQDGYIITSKGHLHDGGIDISIKINGREQCVSKAEYGGVGATRRGPTNEVWTTIRTMTYCPGPVRVKKGDKVSLEAHYDISLHPARLQRTGMMAEQMSLVTFFVAMEKGNVDGSS